MVEVAPAPKLANATRKALYDDAVKLCRHVGYRNAGTVEVRRQAPPPLQPCPACPTCPALPSHAACSPLRSRPSPSYPPPPPATSTHTSPPPRRAPPPPTSTPHCPPPTPTTQFMVDKDNRHYFLEVNPRVQVRPGGAGGRGGVAATGPPHSARVL